MKDALKMWSNTRMVVLTAISASVYVVILIPFKFIPLIPGLAELRPAGAIPPLVSLLFGPAGAFGSAFGNLVGDFFGTLGPGSFFGFIGNFLYGYIPYRMWMLISNKEFEKSSLFSWIKLELSIAIGAISCAVFIGWGISLLGLLQFYALANVISLNNLGFGLLLCPFLYIALYPRLKNWGLVHSELMEIEEKISFTNKLGFILVIIGALAGLIFGNLADFGFINIKGFEGSLGTSIFVLPFIITLVIGVSLL